ncbi:hypothetical protein KPC_1066 [Acinetobacter stercoris]|uniref:Uncharacterized protein n=2 Tax=Acinetobacter stercoris TaxID=2126983 RepID=A0A2U3MWS6_9GAMM|nr:hypothetical protein KPC_1066 [Acinetobacter stercoris]
MITFFIFGILYIFFIQEWMIVHKKVTTMNKIVIALGLAASVALVGCSKEKTPETGATTGEHLENAATQAGHDLKDAANSAASTTATAVDNAANATATATDHAATEAGKVADSAVATAKDATAKTAEAVEHGAAHVKNEASK